MLCPVVDGIVVEPFWTRGYGFQRRGGELMNPLLRRSILDGLQPRMKPEDISL